MFFRDAEPRVLISRMSAIGDAILTLPVASALRDRFPGAYLAWVVEQKSAPMVREQTDLDAVIVLDRGWFTTVRGLRDARDQLRELKVTVSIDCQGNSKSSLAGWLAGARHRIGYDGRHAGELSRFFNNHLVQPQQTHLTDRSLELLQPLGITAPAIRWNLPLAARARRLAADWRKRISATKLAVLNPGGTWPSKLWEADRFAATARYLRDRYQYRSVVVWGSTDEQATAQAIVNASAGAAMLAPATNLQQLGALIETAELFISGDTGPLHMAVAVGTKTIGLYGATRPGDSGPYGQIALQQAYEGGSRRHRRAADNTAMRAIHVHHVTAAIDQLELNSPAASNAA